MREVKSRLSMIEQIRIADYLRSKREDILRDKPTSEILADDCAKLIGHPVAKSSVRKVFRALGINYTPSRGTGSTSKTSLKLRKFGLRIVINSLGHLYIQAGEKMPHDLYEIYEECQKTAYSGCPKGDTLGK